MDRTTYCGKSIGIECGCDEANEEGTCGNPDCKDCTGAPDEDGDEDYSEPEPPETETAVFTLAPTAAAPAQQLSLFGAGDADADTISLDNNNPKRLELVQEGA